MDNKVKRMNKDVTRKQGTANFTANISYIPQNPNNPFSPRPDTHTSLCISRGKKSRFALLPYYRRNHFTFQAILLFISIKCQF